MPINLVHLVLVCILLIFKQEMTRKLGCLTTVELHPWQFVRFHFIYGYPEALYKPGWKETMC